MPIRAAALLLALSIPAAAGVPLRWTVETSTDPQPYVRRVFRGETVELSATLLSYGAALTSVSNATATFYWQTNGMDTAWWTTNAAVATNVLSATWTPSMDPGASDIIWYLGASNAVGRVYRAHGRFRMIGSPGDSAGGPMPAPTAIWDARYDLAGAAAAAAAAEAALRAAGDTNAIAAAAAAAAELYQPAGDYLTEIPAEISAGAAAGSTAVQPANLGTASVAYAASAGTANAATYVLGDSAWITMSGTTGLLYRVESNGVGYVVSGTLDPDASGNYYENGTYNVQAAYERDDGAYWIWFWENGYVYVISTGRGVLTTPYWIQPEGDLEGVYMPLDLTIGDATVTYATNLTQTNSYAIATTADLETALAAYSPTGHGHAISDVTGLQSELDGKATPAAVSNIAEAAASAALATIPGPGVTTLSGVTPTITGATIYYDFAATNAYELRVATNAPRYAYAIEIAGTNAASFAEGITLRGDWTPSGTNLVVLYPGTGTLYRAAGRAY